VLADIRSATAAHEPVSTLLLDGARALICSSRDSNLDRLPDPFARAAVGRDRWCGAVGLHKWA